MAFIRKVYGILMVQLSMTVGMIALFVYHPDVRMYSRQHPEMQIVAMIMTFVLLIALACCSDFRRRYPLNIILLGLFTLCEGFMLGSVASYYQVLSGATFVSSSFCSVGETSRIRERNCWCGSRCAARVCSSVVGRGRVSSRRHICALSRRGRCVKRGRRPRHRGDIKRVVCQRTCHLRSSEIRVRYPLRGGGRGWHVVVLGPRNLSMFGLDSAAFAAESNSFPCPSLRTRLRNT